MSTDNSIVVESEKIAQNSILSVYATATYQQSTSYGGTATALQGATTLIGGAELAIPAFLQANAGMDFTIDSTLPPIASGGGGTVVYAKFLNFGIGT